MLAKEIVNPESYKAYELRLAEVLGNGDARLGLGAADLDDEIARRTARRRGEDFAEILNRYVPIRGRSILDIGAGFGELVLACLARGADAEGIEPGPEQVEICRLLFHSYGFMSNPVRHGIGEDLPYEDGGFDIVTAQHVLEHVGDLKSAVAEMVRVTRPGGYLFVSVPNYLFPYEGHYKIKWFPLTPKPLGALILRLRGMDPAALLNEIHYTTYPRMMRIWRRHALEIRNITRERLVAGEQVTDIYTRRLVRSLALRFNLFPTVTWLLRKPETT